MTNSLDQNFWNDKWENNQTGWDIGYPSHPITSFFDKYSQKNHRILIPGCGNAYEAAYLLSKGFTNITVIDISEKAIKNIEQRFDKNPNIRILHGDFFDHNGQYDLIIEQTFFCALIPELRTAYIHKTASLLAENGYLIGVLFNKDFSNDGPPFGGSERSYRNSFSKYYEIEIMEPSYNSIPQRQGSELFIKLRVKS